MQIKFKFPALIFYVKTVQKGKGYIVRGKTLGPIVVIGENYKQDKGLLVHELTHAKDFWLHGLLLHIILYNFLRPYRLYSECRAYYKQWLVSGKTQERKKDYADMIWLFYNLKYPREYIEKIFSRYFKEWEEYNIR